MLASSRGRKTISFLIDEIKRHHLATEVADVSVCGAVPPYGELVTGKLVALLMASREIQQSYQERYGSQVSEISSQMAGAPVVRDSKLRLLTTTSLYGISSSQYNRLKLKANGYRGIKEGLAWNELGKTEGFTVTHVSSKTINRMRKMCAAHYGMRRINSVFGEGSSPRTRQVREALNLLGIDHDQILKQGLTRRLYAIELQPNAREVLNERSTPTKFVQPSEKSISSAWISRWVEQRVQRPDVLEKLSVLRNNSVRQQFEERIESVRNGAEKITEDPQRASDKNGDGE
jgi:hypothetical protein